MKILATGLNGQHWQSQEVYCDERGHLVGFDTGQQCCEHYASYIWSVDDAFDIDSSYFVEPFEEVEPPEEARETEWGKVYSQYDELEWTGWKLKDNQGRVGYLILGNAHNGYYSHTYYVGTHPEEPAEVGGYL